MRRIVSGSPAWKPQATLTDVTSGMSAASAPIGHGPTLSPTSAFRSIRPVTPPSYAPAPGRGTRYGRAGGRTRRAAATGPPAGAANGTIVRWIRRPTSMRSSTPATAGAWSGSGT